MTIESTEPLNLHRHEPSEFEGKSVVINGTRYVIGPLWRESSQGFAHALRNQRSGLSLHTIQVRHSYRVDPVQARTDSLTKAKLTAELRSQELMKAGPPVRTCLMRAFEIDTGTVELHEFAAIADTVGGPILAGANRHRSEGRFKAAIAAVSNLLDENPRHTNALVFRGQCQAQAGDFEAALASTSQAVEIEPNLSGYRVQQLYLQLGCPFQFRALALLDAYRKNFPGEHDCDHLGVDAYLNCGQPQKARALLAEAPIPAAVAQKLERSVRAATRAADLARPLGQSILKGTSPPGWLRTLEEAHALFDRDPYLNANLAFALRKAGEFKRASELLMTAASTVRPRWMPHIWINAALCLAEIGEWPQANDLARRAMSLLGYPSFIHPTDAPDFAEWIEDDKDCIVESKKPAGAVVLQKWLNSGVHESSLSAEVKALAHLYQQAYKTYLNSPPPPEHLFSANKQTSPQVSKTEDPRAVREPWWRRILRI
jgi:tetratricopeptide (TPR) repeat protein